MDSLNNRQQDQRQKPRYSQPKRPHPVADQAVQYARREFFRLLLQPGTPDSAFSKCIREGKWECCSDMLSLAKRSAELGLISTPNENKEDRVAYLIGRNTKKEPKLFLSEQYQFMEYIMCIHTNKELPSDRFPTDLPLERLVSLFKLISETARIVRQPNCCAAFNFGSWKTGSYSHIHLSFQDPIEPIRPDELSKECAEKISKSHENTEKYLTDRGIDCNMKNLVGYTVKWDDRLDTRQTPDHILLSDQDDEGSGTDFNFDRSLFETWKYPKQPDDITAILERCEFSLKWGARRPVIVVKLLSTPEEHRKHANAILAYAMMCIAQNNTSPKPGQQSSNPAQSEIEAPKWEGCSINILVDAKDKEKPPSTSTDELPLARGFIRIDEMWFMGNYPEGNDCDQFLATMRCFHEKDVKF